MDDIKQQWMPVGLERFNHLEEKISQAVEGIKTARHEADALRGENSRLNEQLTAKTRENEAIRDEIGKLITQAAEEREKLRNENNTLQQQLAIMRQT